MNDRTLSSILYVEDDPDIQMVARLALEMIGKFDVKACSSGDEALAAVDAGFVPDLILLDVMMPGMDGPATLAALRRLPSVARVPAIFMTARTQENEVALYNWLGALGVIPKPFDPLLLADQLRRLWTGDTAGAPA